VTWAREIELRDFERRGRLYLHEYWLASVTECNRRCAMLARRVEIERNRTLAVWHVCAQGAIDEQNERRTWSLDELVYGNARAMHELVELRVELDKPRKRVVKSDHERGAEIQQLAEMEDAIRFAHEEFRLAPVTIRTRKYFEAQISAEAPVEWDDLPAVRRLFPVADGRDR